jgi:hypothetical protein
MSKRFEGGFKGFMLMLAVGFVGILLTEFFDGIVSWIIFLITILVCLVILFKSQNKYL